MLDSPYFVSVRPIHHIISLSPKNWICFYCGSTNLSGYCEHCNAPKKEYAIWCVQDPRPRPPSAPRPQVCYSRSPGISANEYSKRLIDGEMKKRIGIEFGKVARNFIDKLKGFM